MQSIDVTLRIPIDSPERMMVQAIIEVGKSLDGAKEALENPEYVVDSNKWHDFMYVEGAQGIIKAISERACAAARTAFLNEFHSDETAADLRLLVTKNASGDGPCLS